MDLRRYLPKRAPGTPPGEVLSSLRGSYGDYLSAPDSVLLYLLVL
jgi:hypothetical protein